MAQSAPSGAEVPDAVAEVLSWEALTVQASLDATPDQVHDYLRRAAARAGGDSAQPSAAQARLLAELELTAVVGDPGADARLSDLGEEDPLDSALTVGFGGEDALGVKMIGDRTFARINADALVRAAFPDAARGGPYEGSHEKPYEKPYDMASDEAHDAAHEEASVAAVERFVHDTEQLPDSLAVARDAFQGHWVEADAHLFEAYADAFEAGSDLGRGRVAELAAALADGTALLSPDARWGLIDALRALAHGAALRETGEAHGAQVVAARLPAVSRYALEPLFALLAEECERFGLPPLVSGAMTEPQGRPQRDVTVELAVRNGVLTAVTVDLGQFGAPGAGSLPLRLSLAGGAALPLDEPGTSGQLRPVDVTVALLYLAVWEQQREEDSDRANVPGPVQP